MHQLNPISGWPPPKRHKNPVPINTVSHRVGWTANAGFNCTCRGWGCLGMEKMIADEQDSAVYRWVLQEKVPHAKVIYPMAGGELKVELLVNRYTEHELFENNSEQAVLRLYFNDDIQLWMSPDRLTALPLLETIEHTVTHSNAYKEWEMMHGDPGLKLSHLCRNAHHSKDDTARCQEYIEQADMYGVLQNSIFAAAYNSVFHGKCPPCMEWAHQAKNEGPLL